MLMVSLLSAATSGDEISDKEGGRQIYNEYLCMHQYYQKRASISIGSSFTYCRLHANTLGDVASAGSSTLDEAISLELIAEGIEYRQLVLRGEPEDLLHYLV